MLGRVKHEAGSSQRYKHDSQSVNMGLFTSKFLWCLWTMHVPLAPNAEKLEALVISVVTTAAAAAKLLQSCPTLCDPVDGSPPGSPVPGILQARTLEGAAVSSSKKIAK